MSRLSVKPRAALNKAFLKVKPNRGQIDSFKTNLIGLLDQINESESEEFHKNITCNFLNATYYGGKHYINTKGRNDQVIHNGKDAKSSVGVIIEAKKPSAKGEMLRENNINTKAFQELVLYYLRERITHKNLELKHLIATNIYDWFIFDAQLFEKLFAENSSLVKMFIDFEEGRMGGKKTDFFYKEIAHPAVKAVEMELEYTHFNIRDYENALRNADKVDDTKLIVLYKLLSPEHLLKLPFANDSNSLDKSFYSELLHIIGLTETKDGGKKLIERKKHAERNDGSLLENAIAQLDKLDKIFYLKDIHTFGTTKEERLFNVGLELVITWINRILFLKLLEGQLITYHNGDKNYEFLSPSSIKNYDELNSLFFGVLARKQENRSKEDRQKFEKIPYLNSSLFEPTELERNGLLLSNLEDKTIRVSPQTILKDTKGKKIAGELHMLDYLFAFLNAYDFSSEGAEEIQEDNKTLINASVLGLIFEKINGYKDGSFFTPGFITMYMCRETIRRTVLQKFNDVKGWNCKNFDELYECIEVKNRKEANEIINNLHICDPAVGSGHFLVSALNELIAVKNDLKILSDRDGHRLKEYNVEVVNDELIITDEDGSLFEYHPGHKESQRIQETLFHEKQTIIENCLFGVDLNPNSVKICRLRLWIELLKNAYYTVDSHYKELETLPNIDINIKCGNSLVSRFTLDSDMKPALKGKFSIDVYKVAVHNYRNAHSKDEKREMESLIDTIKNSFKSHFSIHDENRSKLSKKRGELAKLTEVSELFGNQKKTTDWRKKVEKLSKEIDQLEGTIEEIKNGKLYQNAFEWRFEFPEVLDNEGEFNGFDAVIGNPPYVQIQKLAEDDKRALETQQYKTYTRTGDLYQLFYEKGVDILKENYQLCYITSNKWMRTNYGSVTREYLSNGYNTELVIDFGMAQMFDTATTYTNILLLNKSAKRDTFRICRIKDDYNPSTVLLEDYVDFAGVELKNPGANSWIAYDKNEYELIRKIIDSGEQLKNWNVRINYGLKTGFNEAFIIDNDTRLKLISEDPNSNDIINPILRGEDIKPYIPEWDRKWLVNTHNGIKSSKKSRVNALKDYPAVFKWLSKFETELTKRQDKGDHWTNLRNCAYLDEFYQPKIIYPNMTKYLPFVYDKHQFFCNDKLRTSM